MAPRAKTKTTAATKKRQPSPEHLQALATGREQGRLVRRYVDALAANKPKRGRKRTSESVAKRLEQVEADLTSVTGLDRVHLIQERIDLTAELATKQEVVDLSALEAGFIAAAADYGSRKGITYQAWREAGVAPAVLKSAGIRRAAAR